MQRTRPLNSVEIEDQRAMALTKAALESARQLGLTPEQTAAALGVPVGAFKAMKDGKRAVDGYSGEAESADGLVRIVRRLKVLCGDTETTWRSWLRRDNATLGEKPIALLAMRQGSVKVATFLERATAL